MILFWIGLWSIFAVVMLRLLLFCLFSRIKSEVSHWYINYSKNVCFHLLTFTSLYILYFIKRNPAFNKMYFHYKETSGYCPTPMFSASFLVAFLQFCNSTLLCLKSSVSCLFRHLGEAPFLWHSVCTFPLCAHLHAFSSPSLSHALTIALEIWLLWGTQTSPIPNWRN